MSLYKDHDENHHGFDYSYPDEEGDLVHKKRVRRMLEAKIERKRLKEELEDYEGELDDEFDWDNLADR
ncbi:hypothetical protein N9Q05_00495 [bacterium]|nr:hypothetical protein [bacterium]